MNPMDFQFPPFYSSHFEVCGRVPAVAHLPCEGADNDKRLQPFLPFVLGAPNLRKIVLDMEFDTNTGPLLLPLSQLTVLKLTERALPNHCQAFTVPKHCRSGPMTCVSLAIQRIRRHTHRFLRPFSRFTAFRHTSFPYELVSGNGPHVIPLGARQCLLILGSSIFAPLQVVRAPNRMDTAVIHRRRWMPPNSRPLNTFDGLGSAIDRFSTAR